MPNRSRASFEIAQGDRNAKLDEVDHRSIDWFCDHCDRLPVVWLVADLFFCDELPRFDDRRAPAKRQGSGSCWRLRRRRQPDCLRSPRRRVGSFSATTWCAVMFMVCAFAMVLRTDKAVETGGGSVLQEISKPAPAKTPAKAPVIPTRAPQSSTPQSNPPASILRPLLQSPRPNSLLQRSQKNPNSHN